MKTDTSIFGSSLSTKSISVCMATFNGEAFITEQVLSILEQLKPSDELIVIDDCSSDNTVAIIRNIGDPRIVIVVNDSNQREVRSFSRAISLACNDIIFLADQDDVWMAGRVHLMIKKLIESGADVLCSNFTWTDAAGAPLDVSFDGVTAANSAHHLRNIIDIFIGKTNYFGCVMAFRRNIAPIIAPIPSFVESHDLWIALASNLAKSNVHIDEATLLKRKHGSNATSTVSKRALHLKLWSRAIFGFSLLVLMFRLQRFPLQKKQVNRGEALS